METFEDLLYYLRDIPNINCGGCAISALAMYRWLKANKKKAQIVYFYSSWAYDLKEGNSRLKYGLGEKAYACSHALLKYNGKFYDCDGEQTDDRKHQILPEKIVVKSINLANAWNPSFNRRYVKHIQTKTNVNLSDIKIW